MTITKEHADFMKIHDLAPDSVFVKNFKEIQSLKAEIKELKEWNDNLEKTAVNQYIEIQELKKADKELKNNFEFAKKQIVLKHEEIKELKKINN